MEEEMDLTEQLLEKLQFSFDYDGLDEEDFEEAKEEGFEEGFKKGFVKGFIEKFTEEVTEGRKKQEREGVLIAFKTIYPNEDTEFLNDLSYTQYMKLSELLINI